MRDIFSGNKQCSPTPGVEPNTPYFVGPYLRQHCLTLNDQIGAVTHVERDVFSGDEPCSSAEGGGAQQSQFLGGTNLEKRHVFIVEHGPATFGYSNMPKRYDIEQPDFAR